MKYLSHYTEEAHTAAIEAAGAFFAFNTEQFKEKARRGVQYISLRAGLICPRENVDQLLDGIRNATDAGIQADITENGIKAIIHRELANHESHIGGCIDNAVAVLMAYPGITREMVEAEYRVFLDRCIKEDLF